eukprot:1543102-Ditylum_brightwellii.AAC.1
MVGRWIICYASKYERTYQRNSITWERIRVQQLDQTTFDLPTFTFGGISVWIKSATTLRFH